MPITQSPKSIRLPGKEIKAPEGARSSVAGAKLGLDHFDILEQLSFTGSTLG